MFVKRFFEPKLAQASYLIGCQSKGEAIVIDPNRDAEPYVAEAAAQGVTIAHVTETHIHADYLSGSRELARRAGATLYLSDEGDDSWKYGFSSDPGVTLINDGDRITVGNILIDAVHTPGHTPEHMTFLVTDGAAADEPIAAATGDFIFVGDVGRPDLLERAANIKGTMEIGARQLYESLQRFSEYPDWLQVWPGHGAGSACGKGISAIPHSTMGYERRFNWAFQMKTEQEFVDAVLAGQPEPPKYFAEMQRLNKEGPRVLGGFKRPERLGAGAFVSHLGADAVIVDTRPAAEFAVGHVSGTLNIPLDGSFTTWAGWLLPYTRDFYLIGDEPHIEAAVRDLAMIGLDRVGGFFTTEVIEAYADAGQPLGSIPQIEVGDLKESLARGGVTLVDVRNQNEWNSGYIEGAIHIPLGYLTDRLDEIPRGRPIVVQCAAGGRSSIGASLLRARGVDQAINLVGGIGAWRQAELPTTDAVPVG
jgi:hydroxyacylglutathione hydrolase